MEQAQKEPFVMGMDTDGDETIAFKVKDLTTYGVLSYDGNEFMASISGFGLNIAFNMRVINSLADAEAMANGMADVFYEALMAELIAQKKEFTKPPRQE